MRRPNHITLDFANNKNNAVTQYWAFNFLEDRKDNPAFLCNIGVSKKYIRETTAPHRFIKANKFLLKPLNYTLSPSSSTAYHSLPEYRKEGLRVLFSTLDKDSLKGATRGILSYSQGSIVDAYIDFTRKPEKYALRNLRRTFLLSWNSSGVVSRSATACDLNTDLININFIRKERLYTKLKYSRTPAYDIVSGGSAALLAGLIGFLASEKFGFELVDSGDFYFFFMYLVFIAFSVGPLLPVANPERGFLELVSLRRVARYYSTILSLLIRTLRK